MKALAGLLFAAVLTPLGLRVALPFVGLPAEAQPLESLLIWWTDLLAAPFVALDAGRMVEGFLPGGGRGGPGGFAALDPNIVAALFGWAFIEGLVVTVMALFRRSPGSDA